MLVVWRIAPQLAGSAQINSLHINGGNFAAVLQFDDPIVSLIATDRFVRVNRLRNFQLWRFPTLDQIQNKRGGPNLHRGGPFAHVGIAQDHVKPAVAARLLMRLISIGYYWATTH